MNSHRSVLTRVLGIALAVLWHCGELRADSGKPTIGVVAPLSGYMATFGAAIRNGIELARIDHPKLMNSIEIRFEDDQHDPKRALTAYRSLHLGAHPRAFMAFGFFFPTVMRKEIIAQRIPLVNLSFFAKPAIGNPYVIRSMNHTTQYAHVLADFLAAEKQLEYPVVRVQYEFYQRLTEDAGEHLQYIKPGAKLAVMAEVLPTDQDFRALIVKLKSLKPQRVGVFLFAEQLPTFMRQARESNANFEIFGAAVCETAATIDGAQKYLEGCVYPDNQVSEAFRERYRSRYHNEMQLTFAGAAYDMSTLLADYILSHPSASSSEMLATLESVRERKGALGAFSFKDDPNFGKYYEYPIVMKKIINGVGTVVSK